MKFCLASTTLAILGLSGFSSAAYSISSTYVASNFFSQFNFMTENDPTDGYVNYVDQNTATNTGLINTNNNKIHIGVDSTTVNPGGRGRNSVRIESKTQYTHGLFLLDLNHMPSSTCGLWPAFWTYGPNWPNSGEIDILEGVNNQAADFVSLHTGGTCKATSGDFSGQLTSSDCDVNTGGSTGCSIHSTNTATYGNGLNNAGGGVYAMEWLSSGIKVWFFPRNSGIPSDISSGNPNPAGWGTPIASVAGGSNCNIDSNFANHWIVFDITFCGDWAGADFATNGACQGLASSCQAYVAGNPGAFSQAYWDINSLKVYQQGTSSLSSDGSSSSNSAVPVASVISSSSTESVTEPASQPTSQPAAQPATTSAAPIPSKVTTAASVETSTASIANPVPNSVASPAPSAANNPWWNYSNNGQNVGPNGVDSDNQYQWMSAHQGGHHGRTGSYTKRNEHIHAHAHAHAHGRRGRRFEKHF